MTLNLHRLRKLLKNFPNLLRGYNIYVDTDKLRLIDHAFRVVVPAAQSFADLGGVWKVHAAYTRYVLRNFGVQRGVIVDTDFPDALLRKLSVNPRLQILNGDFATEDVASRIGQIDIMFLFDVLLHQANPSWEEVLELYSSRVRCMVIYNQQYVQSSSSVRLTSLPLKEYVKLAPGGKERQELYQHVYSHGDEIHPKYNKPWRDIHNIFQWGITDQDLRAVMKQLGFRDVYYRNLGRFSTLDAFENHAFIFRRD